MGGKRQIGRARLRRRAAHSGKRNNRRNTQAALLLAGAVLLATVMPANTQSPETGLAVDPDCDLTILTSYPESFYAPFVDRFSASTNVATCVINKNTISILDHMREKRQPEPDLIWSSSPIAFRMLQDAELLAQVPEKVRPPADFGGLAVDAPDGSRFGFALSRVGLMWAKTTRLPVPSDLKGLTDRALAGRIGMTSPARSGTTHLFVEVILQQYGWQEGWAVISRLGGNIATITARSFGVPEGVRKGRFAFGIGIDFLASVGRKPPGRLAFKPLSAQVFPASVAITRKGAGNPLAGDFVDGLRSAGAQALLLDPAIARIPVLPGLWREAGFTPDRSPAAPAFDARLAARRLAVVTALFDEMITYRQVELAQLWDAVHRLEGEPLISASSVMSGHLDRVRTLLESVPVAPFMADLNLLEPLPADVEFRSLDGRLRIQDSWAHDFSNRFDRARELVAQLDAFIADTATADRP